MFIYVCVCRLTLKKKKNKRRQRGESREGTGGLLQIQHRCSADLTSPQTGDMQPASVPTKGDSSRATQAHQNKRAQRTWRTTLR